MNQADIVLGADYAISEPVREGVEDQRVRIVEKVRSGRWKVSGSSRIRAWSTT
ncbi:MAG: hypothetical protein GY788_17585 [bacterium]|nr:hypothetical protein [bacterium]